MNGTGDWFSATAKDGNVSAAAGCSGERQSQAKGRPAPTIPNARPTMIAFQLASNNGFVTASASCATVGDAFPPAQAARMVASRSSPPSVGAATSNGTPAPTANVNPRRMSRLFSRWRPRSRRPLTEPGVQPSIIATSSCERPSRQQRMRGKRNTSGSRCSSSSRMASNSREDSSSRGLPEVRLTASASTRSRRLRVRRAVKARLQAVRWSHAGREAGRRRSCARRANARKVAWNTSSAKWWSPIIRRATPSTMGP